MAGELCGPAAPPGLPILAGGFQLGNFLWTGVTGVTGVVTEAEFGLMVLSLPSILLKVEGNAGVDVGTGAGSCFLGVTMSLTVEVASPELLLFLSLRGALDIVLGCRGEG